MIKIGYKASAEQFGPKELLDYSVLAEQSGFDSVFISDHFQPWRHTGGHAPNSLVWLGALGARTSRIVMGTSVLTPTFRYHPSIVAQAFGTLGAMCPGRSTARASRCMCSQATTHSRARRNSATTCRTSSGARWWGR